MINQHSLDRESFAREATVETMKDNAFLKHGDTVLVALGDGGYSFYNIVNDPNVIQLNNGLFAVMEKDKRRYDKAEIDAIIAKLNEKIEGSEENNQVHIQLQQAIQNLSEKLSQKADINHTHTKSQITDFPLNLPNPFALTIVNGVNRVTYDGSESREITIAAGGGAPEAHTHNAEDIIQDREHQLVSVAEKDKWNSKADITHNHDERYKTSEEITNLLTGKANISHNHYATNITTDSERNFVSDAEKDKWNGKADQNHKHRLLTIRNGSKMIVYDGSEDKDIFIDSGQSAPTHHQHDPIDIVQNSSNRFVSDSEKDKWNGKAEKTHSHQTLTIRNGSNSIVYDGTTSKEINIVASDGTPKPHIHNASEITTNSERNFVSNSEKYTWNSKADGSHKHSASDINTDDSHLFITSSERNKWNGKADGSHSHNASSISTDSTHRFVTDSEKNTWNGKANANHTHTQYSATNHNHNGTYLPVYGGTINGHLTVTGDVRASKVFNAVWNDYAEFFERGEETEPGDLIALDCSSDKEQYIKASLENPVLVGVHSDSFAHLIGGKEVSFEENIKEFIPVGLAGRVKCKVIGKVLKGQYIGLSNLPGIGTTVDYLNPYIVGIALEDKLTEGLGIVKILIK